MQNQLRFGDYVNRWLFSTNAKDIAVLYFIFSLFCGILGSFMSLVLRLELAAPGNQLLMGNHQLFNVIVTAHAVLMGVRGVSYKGSSISLDRTITFLVLCIKAIRAWRVKLVGVIQSAKPNWKDTVVEFSRNKSELRRVMTTIRNLILVGYHSRDTNCLELGYHMHSNTISALQTKYDRTTSERRYIASKSLKPSHNLVWGTPLRSLETNKDWGASWSKPNLRFGITLEAAIINRSYSTSVKSKRVTGVVPNIVDIAKLNNLVVAYESIKSKPGNMTEGSNEATLDGISIGWLRKISEQLLEGKFKFSPGRLVKIPKPGKSEKRNLIIADPREKVVQKAIEIILNGYYDPMMSDNSHGFRPGKGVQSCIRKIEQDFQSSRFVIEGDLRKAFDSIPHDKLLDVLKKDIKCVKTLELIKNMIKAGYKDGDKIIKSQVGVPQGSVLSPLLCNIYLDALDRHIEILKERYDVAGRSKKNPEYNKLSNRASYIRKKGLLVQEAYKTEYKNIMWKMLRTPSKSLDKIKISYVRYADDFIIGVEGPMSLAKDIKEEIRILLEGLGLTLNIDKTKITDFEQDNIVFLGYKIRSQEKNEKMFEVLYDEKLKRKITRRKKVRLSFEFDYKKILGKLAEAKFIRLRTKQKENDTNNLIFRGTFRGNLVNLDHSDILIYYNSVVRGIYNYYCICRNHGNLFNILWLLKESCALTLARKFKLRTMKKVFKKFGKDLSFRKIVEIKGKAYERKYSFFEPVNTKRVAIKNWSSRLDEEELQGLIRKNWNSKLTRSNLWENCAICSTDKDVEMHHVRSIRDLRDPKGNNKDWFTRAMNGINRKQIPLCRTHHMKLHHNKLDVFETTCFNNYINKKKQVHIEEFTKYAKKKLISLKKG